MLPISSILYGWECALMVGSPSMCKSLGSVSKRKEDKRERRKKMREKELIN